MKDKKNSFKILISSFIILLVGVIPLLRQDFIWTHDSNLYPTILYEFDQGIRAGHLLPRWSADFWFGLGSPYFNFIQPLFFYLAEIFHLIGFGLVTSIKIVTILGLIIGWVAMYFFAKEIWGKIGGFISALVFTFFPYRLALIYIRGDFAELFATSLIPLILFYFLRLAQTKKLSYFLLSIFFYSSLILMHNIENLIFTPLLIIYLIIISWKELKKIYWLLISAIIFSLSLASFYFIPAFFEKNYLALEALTRGMYDFHKSFLNLGNLFLPKWDSSHFYQIGISNILIFIIIILIILLKNKLFNNRERKNLYFFILLIIFSSLMMFPLSTILWEHIPYLKFIQFPWRFLSYQALAFGLIAGGLIKPELVKKVFKNKLSLKILVIVYSFIIVLTNIYCINPLTYIAVEADNNYHPFIQAFSKANIIQDIETKSIYFNLHNFLPDLVPRNVKAEKFVEQIKQNIIKVKFSELQEEPKPLPKVEVLQGDIQWEFKELDPQAFDFNLISQGESSILINQFYFPGWKAFLDNQEIAIKHDNDLQLMIFKIPSGEHKLQLRFTNTPIRTISEIISLIAFVFFLILLIRYFKRSRITKLFIKKENPSDVNHNPG